MSHQISSDPREQPSVKPLPPVPPAWTASIMSVLSVVPLLYLAAWGIGSWLADISSEPAMAMVIWMVTSFVAGSLYAAFDPDHRWQTGRALAIVGAVVALAGTALLAAWVWGINSGSGGPPVAESGMMAGVGSLAGGLLGLLATCGSGGLLKRLAPSMAAVLVCALAGLFGLYLAIRNERIARKQAPAVIAAQAGGPVAQAVFGRKVSVRWNDPRASDSSSGVIYLQGQIPGTRIGVHSTAFIVDPRSRNSAGGQEGRFYLSDVVYTIPWDSCRFLPDEKRQGVNRSVGVQNQPLVEAGLSPELVRKLRLSPAWKGDNDQATATIVPYRYEVRFAQGRHLDNRYPPSGETIGPGKFDVTVRPIR